MLTSNQLNIIDEGQASAISSGIRYQPGAVATQRAGNGGGSLDSN